MSIEMKAAENYTSKNALLHHGILGQKWGVTNGPPYPLDDSVSTGKRLKKQSKSLKKEKKKSGNKSNWEKASNLSYEELEEEVKRLNLEKRYSDLMSEKNKTINEAKKSKLKKFVGKHLETAVNKIVDAEINSLVKNLTTKIDANTSSKETKTRKTTNEEKPDSNSSRSNMASTNKNSNDGIPLIKAVNVTNKYRNEPWKKEGNTDYTDVTDAIKDLSALTIR